ncbi:MAG: hypothetical protein ACFB10_10890 [Salibacteraceae bacterium]
MDLQADINWIIAELRKVKDPNLVEVFKSLLKYRESKTAVEAVSLLDYNTELAAAESRMAAGHYLTQEEVERNSEEW